jgi:CheY-specific phosphatase CheX
VSADTACIRGIAGAVAGYVIAGMAAKMFNKIAYEAMTNTTRYNEQVTNAGRNPKPE